MGVFYICDECEKATEGAHGYYNWTTPIGAHILCDQIDMGKPQNYYFCSTPCFEKWQKNNPELIKKMKDLAAKRRRENVVTIM